MAKVTIILTDNAAGDGIECEADFDQPGKSYEEMTADPTIAVAIGLGMLKMATAGLSGICDYSGGIKDEFGFERGISNQHPL